MFICCTFFTLEAEWKLWLIFCRIYFSVIELCICKQETFVFQVNFMWVWQLILNDYTPTLSNSFSVHRDTTLFKRIQYLATLRILLIASTHAGKRERVKHASARSDRVTHGNEKAMWREKTSNCKVYFCCELLLLGRRLYLFDTKPWFCHFVICK